MTHAFVTHHRRDRAFTWPKTLNPMHNPCLTVVFNPKMDVITGNTLILLKQTSLSFNIKQQRTAEVNLIDKFMMNESKIGVQNKQEISSD